MDKNSKPPQEEIKLLRDKSKRSLETAAAISKILEPRIFTLLREHIENTRNFIIVVGALAAFSIAFLSTGFNVNEVYLIIGVIGLLLSVIFGLFYLNNYTSSGMKSYLKKYKKWVEPEEEMTRIINQFIEEEISREELIKLIKKRDKEVREEFLVNKVKERIWTNDYTLDLLIWLMAMSLFSIILSFVFSYIIFM